MWSRAFADQIDDATDPDTALAAIDRYLAPLVFSSEVGESVTAALLRGLLSEMLEWKDAFEETVEKPFGIVWSAQFDEIRRDVLVPWARRLRALPSDADPADLFLTFRDLVHDAKTYTRIRPR